MIKTLLHSQENFNPRKTPKTSVSNVPATTADLKVEAALIEL
jgi:hypothetical protein